MSDLQINKLKAEIRKLEVEIEILKRPFYKKVQWMSSLLPILVPIFSFVFYFMSDIGEFRKMELECQKELLTQQVDDFSKDSSEFGRKRKELETTIYTLDNEIKKREEVRKTMLEENSIRSKEFEAEKQRLDFEDKQVLDLLLNIQKISKNVLNLNDSARVLGDKLFQVQNWLNDEQYSTRIKRQRLQSLNLLN